MKNSHKAALTISRPNYGDGRKKISITVKDREAVTEFLEIEIDLAAFTECITGLSSIDCDMVVKNLDKVGKVREQDKIKFKMPDNQFHNKDVAREEAAKHTPEGWEFSGHFGPQNSFFTVQTDEGEREDWATTSIMRWVDKEGAKQ